MRWFFAEFLVVVAGILVAMGLNAWYQGRIETRNEHQYLTLLGRDLEAMAQFLDETIAFENLQQLRESDAPNEQPLAGGYRDQQDVLWSLPKNAPLEKGEYS